jgi:hypothetical protein
MFLENIVSELGDTDCNIWRREKYWIMEIDFLFKRFMNFLSYVYDDLKESMKENV